VFGMGTGGTIQVWSPESSKVVAKVARHEPGAARGCIVPGAAEERMNAAKRLAVSTGQLRRLPALHTRPIDLVIFQEPSSRRTGGLVLRRASRLDAFSVYPGRTWLPSAAPSGTTGTPEVRPSQSSRTRERAAQASYARNR
jgi:co-chaperonin GroES (HSP10)